MDESLLSPEALCASGEENPAPVVESGPDAATAERPREIPEKFWDKEKGEVRTDALLKSYQELERKLGRVPGSDIPPSAQDYRIELQNELVQSDAEINDRLHAAGFSNAQAQLVYELAAERLAPMVAEVASVFEAESQIDRLVNHFGGPEPWRETARQISAWGKASLPREVFETLATTEEGVLTMHRMMSAGEPSLVREGTTPSGTLSEADLKQLMRDPRYWRDQDPRIIEKVRQGFRTLYPD